MSMRDGPNSPLSHTAASLSSWSRFVLVGILFFWLSCAWSRAAKRDSPLSGRVGAGLGGVFLRFKFWCGGSEVGPAALVAALGVSFGLASVFALVGGGPNPLRRGAAEGFNLMHAF